MLEIADRNFKDAIITLLNEVNQKYAQYYLETIKES
jgi:hypothetical protein